MVFYHGSERSDLSELSLFRADCRAPFGPAIYLSKDRSVADRHAFSGGAIYEVRLSGDPSLIVDYDRELYTQSLNALCCLERCFGKRFDEAELLANARSIVERFGRIYEAGLGDELDAAKLALNQRLARSGVWMVCGTLAGNEDHGRMDAGVQYAVLEPKYCHIVARKGS